MSVLFCYYVISSEPEKSAVGGYRMYPRGITRPCKQKTDARIGIRVPLANSTRKNRGKNGGFLGGGPGRDASAGPETERRPEYAILPATRAKLRTKNRRDVVIGRTSKQVKCAVGP